MPASIITEYQPRTDITIASPGNVTCYVSPSGDDSNSGLTQSQPKRNIHALLEAIHSDNKMPLNVAYFIQLAPGEYTLPADYIMPRFPGLIYITGGTGIDDAPDYIINVNGVASSAFNTANNRIACRNLTIKGKCSLSGAALLHTSTAFKITLQQCLFEGIDKAVNYRGIQADASDLRLSRCGFKNIPVAVYGVSSIIHNQLMVANKTSDNGTLFSVNNSILISDGLDAAFANTLWSVSTGGKVVLPGTGVYSSAEQMTGEICEGKPVYRRTFSGNIVGAVNIQISTSLIASGIANHVRYGGWWQLGGADGNKQSLGGEMASANRYASHLYTTTAGQLLLATISTNAREGTTNNAYWVWVEYTKV
jgi:hypothetical protein